MLLLLLLLVVSGDDAIKHLLSRGAHRRFGYKSLLMMLAWYFMFAAVAAGSAISSGLFVPMLMMGATVGRLVGLATTDIADKYGALLTRECSKVYGPKTPASTTRQDRLPAASRSTSLHRVHGCCPLVKLCRPFLS